MSALPQAAGPAPLVLTALLDDLTAQRFDALRRLHFPPERNHLDAHLTLFHRLPGDHEAEIVRTLVAAADTATMPARVTGVRLLGRGVAFVLRCEELSGLRSRLAREWAPWLSAQDRGKTDLHVTVQNKVDPAAARALHAQLDTGVVAHEAQVVGLGLWRYLGGPWQPVRRLPFTG